MKTMKTFKVQCPCSKNNEVLVIECKTYKELFIEALNEMCYDIRGQETRMHDTYVTDRHGNETKVSIQDYGYFYTLACPVCNRYLGVYYSNYDHEQGISLKDGQEAMRLLENRIAGIQRRLQEIAKLKKQREELKKQVPSLSSILLTSSGYEPKALKVQKEEENFDEFDNWVISPEEFESLWDQPWIDAFFGMKPEEPKSPEEPKPEGPEGQTLDEVFLYKFKGKG